MSIVFVTFDTLSYSRKKVVKNWSGFRDKFEVQIERDSLSGLSLISSSLAIKFQMGWIESAISAGETLLRSQ